MSRIRSSIRAGVYVILTTSVCAAAAPAPATQPSDLEKENAELRKQFDTLQEKVRALQRQLDALRGPRLAPPEPRLTPPQPRPAPRQPYIIPRPPMEPQPRMYNPGPGPDWVPREFNGRTYYLIPCDPQADAGASPPPPRPTAVRSRTLAEAAK